MRTLQLVSLNLRWLRRNPQRNLLVSPHFSFFTLLNFSSPLLFPSPAFPATPASVIIINNTPVGSPLPLAPRSPHSHIDARQEAMALQPTLIILQEIIHKSINQILFEHCRFLHMIPFVDVTHKNDIHWGFREELNSLLGQELQAYPKQDITGIVSRFLEKKSFLFTFYLF
ncbi:hypothetical protein O181_099836 [Austropuccinia psidii MF-1]|uniref:Uncharacterized protein n=1 Tax=Austropuccinia psidii MF-1 TaxID=1389203 RepID=A0A9Q3PH83_9BASI|nr:hypothetical protein [Austropuccinia psidii MF-1]